MQVKFLIILILIGLVSFFTKESSYAQCVNIINYPSSAKAGDTVTISGTVATGFGARPVLVSLTSSRCASTYIVSTMVCSNANLSFSSTLTIPNSLSPGGYFINGFVSPSNACNGSQTGCACVSSESKAINAVTEVENETRKIQREINLYPVPCSDELYLSFSQSLGYPDEIKVFNVLGYEVKLNHESVNTYESYKLRINTSVFEKGIYSIVIHINSEIMIKKFIKI